MAYKKSTESSKKNVSRQTFKTKDKSSKSHSEKKYARKSNDGKSFKRRNDDDATSRKRRFSATDERPKRAYRRSESTEFKRRNDDDATSRKRRFSATDERPKRTYRRSEDTEFKRRNDDDATSRKRRFSATDERPKRAYRRSENTEFKRRNDDDTASRKRRFSATDERPKRTYRRSENTEFKRRNDDDTASRKRRFSTTDERPKRTYRRSEENSINRRFSDRTEQRPTNYIRTSEPVDSRLRRQIKEKKAGSVRTEDTGTDNKIRLNKFIANSGVCSRREADTFIKAGVVMVNGVVVTELGVKVSPADEILFNGERLHGEKKVYLVMNKPKNFVTTVEDPHADKTVMTIVRNYCTERVYPVGRLDKNTTGVLLFTNDGELTKVLTHPSYEKKKIYAVGIDKNLTKNDMTRLANGVQLDDGMAFFDEISYTDNDDKRKIGVEIHSGRNRIVRRMFEHLGYKITKLDRVYFAGLTKSKLKRGECRLLSEREIISLKMGAYE